MQLRRLDRKMADGKAEELLREGEYGVLSTCGGAIPYGVPVNYVYYDSAIWFHCAAEGRKLDNLRANPSVSFCVVGGCHVEGFTTRYECVIATGSAETVSGEDRLPPIRKLVEKYSPGIPGSEEHIAAYRDKFVIVKITVTELSGKENRKK